jgi:acyl carrier protein
MMAEVLEKAEGSVGESDIFRDYPEWDSLSVLAVMAMINEEYGIVISSELLRKAKTIDELFAVIKEKIA